MTNRPICPKGQRKTGSPCIFCEDGAYCAHQYYCPATRRYENTGWRACRRIKEPAGDGGTIPSQAAPDSPFAKGAFPAAAGTGDALTEEQRTDVGAAALSGPSTGYNDPPRVSGPTNEQEVAKVGAKKPNRRKSRKG